ASPRWVRTSRSRSRRSSSPAGTPQSRPTRTGAHSNRAHPFAAARGRDSMESGAAGPLEPHLAKARPVSVREKPAAPATVSADSQIGTYDLLAIGAKLLAAAN